MGYGTLSGGSLRRQATVNQYYTMLSSDGYADTPDERATSHISTAIQHSLNIDRWGRSFKLIDYACLSSFQDTLKMLSRIGHVQVLINFGLGSRIWIDWLLLCGYLISMPAVKEPMEKVIHIQREIIHRMMLQWLRGPTLGQIAYHWQCENIMK